MGSRKIGIIGGAGPMAGALMFEQIVTICQKEYGCQDDCDFPEIVLHSYPFSEMLAPTIDPKKIEDELTTLANSLDVSTLIIACNTLHAFINADFPIEKCIQIPVVIRETISSFPVVICSSTSRKFALHQRFFNCIYPSLKAQKQLDQIIKIILSGHLSIELSEDLSGLLVEEGLANILVVLGCTEFSLLHNRYPISNLNIIDPSYLVAKKACETHFNKGFTELIPNVFQNLVSGNAGASDLQPTKQTMCKHMVDADGCKDEDAGAASNQILNHVRYTLQGTDIETDVPILPSTSIVS